MTSDNDGSGDRLNGAIGLLKRLFDKRALKELWDAAQNIRTYRIAGGVLVFVLVLTLLFAAATGQGIPDVVSTILPLTAITLLIGFVFEFNAPKNNKTLYFTYHALFVLLILLAFLTIFGPKLLALFHQANLEWSVAAQRSATSSAINSTPREPAPALPSLTPAQLPTQASGDCADLERFLSAKRTNAIKISNETLSLADLVSRVGTPGKSTREQPYLILDNVHVKSGDNGAEAPRVLNVAGLEFEGGNSVEIGKADFIIKTLSMRGAGARFAAYEDLSPPPEAPAGTAGAAGDPAGSLRLLPSCEFSAVGMSIDLRGRPGQRGGKGVTGAIGAPGQKGDDAADHLFDCAHSGGTGGRGGQGGQGGPGFPGGPGGAGGYIGLSQIAYDAYQRHLITIEMGRAARGGGGPGGDRGPGGPGGGGGSGSTYCGGGDTGPRGPEGEPGPPGPDGLDGAEPRIEEVRLAN